MKIKYLLFALFATNHAHGQVVASTPGLAVFAAKEYSKEIALYKAKAFVMNTLLGSSETPVKFEMDPLAASNTGEVTSLVYHCAEKNKEGLVLGFFGDRWNASGVIYQAYAFKDLPKSKAVEILGMLEKQIEINQKYINSDIETNNVFFKYDDMVFVIYKSAANTKIRIFWENFDAEWENIAFKRTNRRL